MGPQGLILGTGYRPKLPVADITETGNVIICRRPGAPPGPITGHEARHSTQYACFLGLPFLPLYGLCALCASGGAAIRATDPFPKDTPGCRPAVTGSGRPSMSSAG